MPWPGHCVVFLGKTLYSHSAALHPGVLMGTSKLSGKPYEILGGGGNLWCPPQPPSKSTHDNSGRQMHFESKCLVEEHRCSTHSVHAAQSGSNTVTNKASANPPPPPPPKKKEKRKVETSH